MKTFFERIDALSLWQVVAIMLVIALIAILLEIAFAAKRRGAGPRDPNKYEGRDQVPAGLDRDIRRAIGQDIPPQPGDRRHSNYFDGTVELIEFSNDNDYYFKPINSRRFPYLNGKRLHNQSAWSKLPTSRRGL